MNRSVQLLVFLVAFISTSDCFSENFTDECRVWRAKAEGLGSSRSLKELVPLIEGFPMVRVERLERLGGNLSNDQLKNAIENAFSRPSCPPIKYLDLFRECVVSKKFDAGKKRKLVHQVLERIASEKGGADLVNFLTLVGMIELSIDAKVLKVSDALYLKLFDLRSVGRRSADRAHLVPTGGNLFSPEIYESLREESIEALILNEELGRWAKRVLANQVPNAAN